MCINKNILHKIIDNMAFIKWKNNMINMNREFFNEYSESSYISGCAVVRRHYKCYKCPMFIYKFYNYRSSQISRKISNKNICYLCSKICLPKNY